MLWTGRILTILIALFLLIDAIMKIARNATSMQFTVQMLGYPASAVAGIGLVLLLCTVLYAIPRTAFIGAILLTGYLGGAVASGVRAATPMGSWIFPLAFGVMVWVALWLRDRRLAALSADTFAARRSSTRT
jgi:hypothetical protein